MHFFLHMHIFCITKYSMHLYKNEKSLDLSLCQYIRLHTLKPYENKLICEIIIFLYNFSQIYFVSNFLFLLSKFIHRQFTKICKLINECMKLFKITNENEWMNNGNEYKINEYMNKNERMNDYKSMHGQLDG